MDKKPKISVIVPIYNSERFISRCIESIINQTFEDIEIILINDGSMDRTQEICEYYASKDKRIVLINKSNGGSNSARIVGIKQSKGDYLSFIDSDDWIERDMLFDFYQYIKDNNNIDIVVGGFVIDSNNKYREVFNKENSMCMLPEEGLCQMFEAKLFDWSLCSKLYSKTLFNNGIIFEKGVNGLGDDLIANWLLFNTASKIMYAPIYKYYYYMNNESLTHKPFSSEYFEFFKIYRYIVDSIINCENKNVLKSVLKSALNFELLIINYAEKKYEKYNEEIIEGIKQIKIHIKLFKEIAIEEAKHMDVRFGKINKSYDELINEKKQQQEKTVKFSEDQGVYIYGAGKIASEAIDFLSNLNVKIIGIIVTDVKRNGRFFRGYSVKSIDEVLSSQKGEKVKIILAMNEKHTQEVICEIESMSKLDYFDFGQYSYFY